MFDIIDAKISYQKVVMVLTDELYLNDFSYKW